MTGINLEPQTEHGEIIAKVIHVDVLSKYSADQAVGSIFRNEVCNLNQSFDRRGIFVNIGNINRFNRIHIILKMWCEFFEFFSKHIKTNVLSYNSLKNSVFFRGDFSKFSNSSGSSNNGFIRFVVNFNLTDFFHISFKMGSKRFELFSEFRKIFHSTPSCFNGNPTRNSIYQIGYTFHSGNGRFNIGVRDFGIRNVF